MNDLSKDQLLIEVSLNLGKRNLFRGELDEAEKYFMTAASLGDSLAMASIALIKMEKNDRRGYHKWLEKAVDAGFEFEINSMSDVTHSDDVSDNPENIKKTGFKDDQSFSDLLGSQEHSSDITASGDTDSEEDHSQ